MSKKNNPKTKPSSGKTAKKTVVTSAKTSTKAPAKTQMPIKKSVSVQSSTNPINKKTSTPIKPVKLDNKIKIFLIVAVLLTGVYFLKHLFVVALVNGQFISRIQIIKELEKKQGQYLLDQKVSELLIYQEAAKKGVKIEQSDVDAEMKKLEESYGLQGGDLAELLKLQGMTKEDLAQQIKIQKIIEKMLADQVSVTEEEIDKYIADNKASIGKDEEPTVVRTQVKEQLTQQKMSEKFQEMLTNLKNQAKIRYFLKY